MTAWLTLIGIGEDGLAGLPAAHRRLVDDASVVIGAARVLAALPPAVAPARPRAADVPGDFIAQQSFDAIARALAGETAVVRAEVPLPEPQRRMAWEPGLERMIAQLMDLRDTPTVVLASGDPMWFGMGATLTRTLLPSEFAVLPAPSAFQHAAARLHWPLQSIDCLSLHGRPVEMLHPALQPNNRILALTSDRTTIDLVLELLVDRGYGQSQVTVLENLGGSDERITEGLALGFESGAVGDLYVLAIDCVAEFGARLRPTVPGLPDDAFVTDGQLTKREVRAMTLARLAPFPGAVLWDVGAGSGSIGIEWMRSARGAHAIAFEREGERLQNIAVNAAALGVPHLEIVPGSAPESFGKRAPPDAIFIGGDVANDLLFDACWTALKPGGQLVANAVTVDGERALYDWQEQLGGDITRIETSMLDRVGGRRVLRPRMAVTQWSVVKLPHGEAAEQ
jgi:precorrin-6Y C5,15-methyltransferase (decarboxylating)